MLARVSDADAVRRFRQALLSNGYEPVAVETRGKRPIGLGWQNGTTRERVLNVMPEAANTGILTRGLRVVDIDIDDPAVVERIITAAADHLPGGGLVRRRSNSCRVALLYRAAAGSPKKVVQKGRFGKVEILGDGQQVVVDGVHPSGGLIEWRGGRSPATVVRDAVPAVDEATTERFLSGCATILEATEGVTFAGDPLSGGPASVFASLGSVDELSAGVAEEQSWFDRLSSTEKREVIDLCLSVHDNTASDPRDEWMKVVFAVADAEWRGCEGASELALAWSRRGAHWTDEAAFDALWRSFHPGKGITVGTLLRSAGVRGVDFSTWKDRGATVDSVALQAPASSAASGAVGGGGTGRIRAMAAASLPLVPPKREWLHGTDVVRGAVSLLVAPGARGKSTWLLTLALACSSGRRLLGSHVFGGPLRVLYTNAEDSTDEIARRLRAAMQHHVVTDAEISGLFIAGAEGARLALLVADRGQPKPNPVGWASFEALLDEYRPDIVIVDPLVSLTGGVSLNDNAAAALLIGNFARIAASRRIGIVIAHHVAKNRETGSADAAMGAATIVNLARICMALEPLSESDAGKIGVPPWEAKNIFRVVGTKLNLSPPGVGDRWFRLTSVTLANAQPPIYPDGDTVGVVETFSPTTAPIGYPQAILAAAVAAVASANPPLSPSKRSTGNYAVPIIARALRPLRGGKESETEAKAVLDHLVRTGRVRVGRISVPRPGRGPYERDALIVVAPVAASAPGNSSVTTSPANAGSADRHRVV